MEKKDGKDTHTAVRDLNAWAKSHTQKDLASFFDHSVLKPTTTEGDVEQAAKEVAHYGFGSLCVTSSMVEFAQTLQVPVCAVVGFPHGTVPAQLKVQEAEYCLGLDVDELDFVININRFRTRRQEAIEEVRQFVQACRAKKKGVVIKAIMETCYLTDEEVVIFGKHLLEAGCDYIKTSTGFGSAGATPRLVEIMVTLAKSLGRSVKASGGIRDGKFRGRQNKSVVSQGTAPNSRNNDKICVSTCMYTVHPLPFIHTTVHVHCICGYFLYTSLFTQA